jgi:hypothetical protein
MPNETNTTETGGPSFKEGEPLSKQEVEEIKSNN